MQLFLFDILLSKVVSIEKVKVKMNGIKKIFFNYSLRIKIIFWVVITLVVTQGSYFYILLKDRGEQSFEMTEKASIHLSSIIKKSLEYDMERNRLEDVQKTIELIGSQKDVENVMIINKKGQVTYSAKRWEIGKVMSIEERSCTICHQQKPYPYNTLKVFTLGGERILRNVHPINNGEKCFGCHDRKDRLLGVLVVDTSLLPLDEGLSVARNRMIFFAVITFVIVALLLALLVFILVDRPIRKLTRVVSRAKEGKLDDKVDIVSGDEFGELGKGFNAMLDKIALFNQQLQKRVETAVEECRYVNAELMRVNRHLEKANRELKKSQAQIVQSEKMAAVGQLAAGVAHEINNPLGSILTYVRLLLKKIDGTASKGLDMPQLREYITTIDGEVNRCKTITRDLLDFSRMKEPEKILTDIRELLEGVLKLTEHQLSEQKIVLHKHFDASIPKIMADPQQLQQVAINVILNATQSMSGGGALEITIQKKSKFIELLFGDSGSGIPEQDLPRIFAPFFTTKKAGEGTGLGLSVAYGIIENHGGTIKAHSKAGEGTTVVIALPVPSGEVSYP
jgi:two-component system NtrC family sensor kinase